MNPRINRSVLHAAAVLMAAQLAEGGAPAGTGSGTATNKKPEVPPAPEGMVNQVFHFRKEKIKDGEGNEIETFKHPSVTIPLPQPTVEELAAIFNAPNGEKVSEKKFILDLVSEAYYDQAREQINEYRENTPKGTVSADVLDYNKLSILALANMPASERGNKVDEEEIADFLKDYTAIMPAALNKDAAKIKAQASLLEKGLRTVKTDKKVLPIMEQCLNVWASNTQAMEDHSKVYDWLTNRIKKWMAAEPKNVLESIF
jgi:hypothetical protein